MTVYAQAAGVSAMVVENETILVNSGGSKMITLNKLGGAIWESLAEPTSLDTIVDQLAKRYGNVDQAVIDADVRAFINHATELGVIQLVS